MNGWSMILLKGALSGFWHEKIRTPITKTLDWIQSKV